MSKKKRTINGFWVLMCSVGILYVSLFLYREIIQSIIGNFSMNELYAVGMGDQPKRVAVLRSNYTKQAHLALHPEETNIAWADASWMSWDRFLDDNGYVYDIIQDEDLETGAVTIDRYSALILPSSRAMSDQQIQQVRLFMEAGGGVMVTWTPGVYRPDSSWRGWRFIEDTFGLQFVRLSGPHASSYETREEVVEGFAMPGLYKPNPDSTGIPDVEPLTPMQIQMQLLTDELDFPPLRAHRWVDTLGGVMPVGDFLKVEVGTEQEEGQPVRQIVRLTHHTKIGGASKVPDHLEPQAPGNMQMLTLRGETPMTAGITGGFRLPVNLYNQAVGVRIIEDRTHPLGFWDDLVETDPESEIFVQERSAGIVYGTYGAGRFVYVGFQREAIALGKDANLEAQMLSRMYANMVDYVMREPVAWMRNWPYPFDAAAPFVGLVEEDDEHAGSLAEWLFAQGIRASYFSTPDKIADRIPLFQKLRQMGEIGIIDTLQSAQQGSYDRQVQLLEEHLRLFEPTGAEITAYRPAEPGPIADSTILALESLGFEYAVPEFSNMYLVPHYAESRRSSLAELGKTTITDRESVDLAEESGGEIMEVLMDEVAMKHQEGGVYQLVFSTDILGAPAYRTVFSNLIQSLKSRRFWITSAGDLARWYRRKRDVQIGVLRRGPQRLVIRVSNVSNESLQQVGVQLDLGSPVAGITVRPDLIRTRVPAYVLQSDFTTLNMLFDTINGGESLVYHIDMFESLDALPVEMAENALGAGDMEVRSIPDSFEPSFSPNPNSNDSPVQTVISSPDRNETIVDTLYTWILASNASRTVADQIAATYRALGFACEVQGAVVDDEPRFRVQYGGYRTRQDAQDAWSDLPASARESAWLLYRNAVPN